MNRLYPSVPVRVKVPPPFSSPKIIMHSRAFNLFLAFACHELLLAAYYFQYVKGLEPCPLCIVQRVAVLILLVVFLVLGLSNAKAGGALSRLLNGVGLLGAVVGIAAAGRQVWMQGLPAELVPSCGPGLDYMMEVFSALEVLKELFTGSGDCAKVPWQMFGYSMAHYTLAFFALMGIFTLWRAFKK